MFPYFDFIVGFIAFVYLLETYLELRQRRRFYEKTIPKEVEHAINQEKFNKNQAYGLDRSTFSLIQDNFNLIHTLLILFLGLIPFLWNW
jgi:STE24 endopeptidase